MFASHTASNNYNSGDVMNSDSSISILIISTNNELWSKVLQDQNWAFQVAPSIQRARTALRTLDNLVLVCDFSCGHFPLSELAELSELREGTRTIAYIDKTQRDKLTKKDLSYIARYCVDYYTSPVPKEMLIRALGHQIGILSLARDNSCQLPPPVSVADSSLILGESTAMLRLKKQIKKVAPVEVNTLICGESGTGKELVARALHDYSPRKKEAFIAVNCGALNEQLVHSELFGHEKGAFTGANQQRTGKIALANKGTLFLDEIGDLPLTQQANLLRFLQEGTIDVLGSNSSIKVDVRVVAATHVDLEQAVIEGRFRQDLYFRLNVLRIDVPSLHERENDILVLAEHFRQKFSREYNQHNVSFSSCAQVALVNYSWPGNVRELINIVKRAVLMSEGEVISLGDLDIFESKTDKGFEPTALTPSDTLTLALEQHDGNVLETAKFLGISRATAYRMIERYNLRTVVERARGQLGLVR